MAGDGRRVVLKLSREHAGVRLDRLFRKLLPGMPLSAVHRMIREGRVRRRGGKLSMSDRLDEGDTVTVRLLPADAEALRERLAGERTTPRNMCELPVLHEDEHVIAFDKPSGVACHPGSGHPLVSTVLGALYGRAGRGRATFRPALAGRLDRDASGVQLAGKTVEGVRGLSALVREGGIAKTYLALVRGAGLAGLAGKARIDSPLLDTKRGRARMKVVSGQDARDRGDVLAAVTHYRVISRGGGAALVEVTLETGRRHQIRAHMAWAGAPLAGDVRYGDRAWNRALSRGRGLKRLFLHCNDAAFEHPVTGRAVHVRSPLPPELARALAALGIRCPTATKRRARPRKKRKRG